MDLAGSDEESNPDFLSRNIVPLTQAHESFFFPLSIVLLGKREILLKALGSCFLTVFYLFFSYHE